MLYISSSYVACKTLTCEQLFCFLPLFQERQYSDCAISMANENKYSNIIAYVHQAVTT